MDKKTRVERRKELRRVQRSKIRQDLLISEYVQYKYFDVYSEAAEFYNTLNAQYPTKYDLRKTDEYKWWKSNIRGVAVKKPKRPKTLHGNIQPSPCQNLDHIEIHPQAQITVTYVEPPQNPDTGESQPASPNPSEQPESSDTGESQPASPNPSEQPESSDTGESQPASPNPSQQPQSPDTGETQPTRPIELQSRKHVYTDNLQLRIPLIPHKSISPAKHPAVTTETLQIVTEEILEEDTIQPSIYEELAPELIEKIISELRLEPDLKDIFTDIEHQFEFEQLGMDIDIDIEDNALENEIDQW